jgi:Fic family protein
MTLRGHYEDRWWEARPGAMGGRRNRQPFAYRAFVPESIAEWDLALGTDAIAALGQATTALDRLNDSRTRLAPLETLARQLLHSESLASSRIEGLVLSQRRLARASFRGGTDDPEVAEAAGNVAAMEQAIAIAARQHRFELADLLAIHRTLLRFALDRGIAGMLRDRQNWIGRNPHNPRDADYIPPPPEYLDRLIEDLCVFLDRDDVPGVLQAAIAHAQFETIHPFADGNGRVGRCLIHATLVRRGLAPHFVPPVSLILAGRAPEYVAGLIDYREGRVDDWVELFANATRLAAQEAERLDAEIETLEGLWIGRLGRPRSDSSAYAVVAALPAQPIVDVAAIQALAGISDVAAGRLMKQLDAVGIVTRIGSGRRHRTWEARELFDLVNEFEQDLRGGPVTKS